MGRVAEDSSTDSERYRGVRQSVAEYSSLPICCVMDLEVHEQRLLIAAEVGPSDVVYGGVCTDLNRYRNSRGTVMYEHLGDFSVHDIGGIVAHVDIFRE